MLTSIDTETFPIRPGLLAPRLVCLTWQVEGESPQIMTRETAWPHILDMLSDESAEWCGVNIPYDWAVLAAEWPALLPYIFRAYDQGRVWDCPTAQACIDIGLGCLFTDPATGAPIGRYSMALLAERYLGLDLTAEKKDPTAWRLRYGELADIPAENWPEKALRYALDDASITLQIAQAQKSLSGAPNRHAQSEQALAAWGLHLAAVWGVRTDAPTVRSVVAQIEKGHREAIQRFSEIGFLDAEGARVTSALGLAVASAYGADPFVPCAACVGTGKVASPVTGKPIQCSTCSATGLDLSRCAVPRTATGRISTAEETLVESGNADLEEFAESRANEKEWTTYRPILLQGVDIPINPEANVLVRTGRTSMRKPNLQNQPRKGRVRECYIPRPGHVFASVDYATLELCTLAQTCLWMVGHSAMADAINAGEDLHLKFAAGVAGVPYAELRARHKAHDKQASDFRQMAKAANFGLPGGLGPTKLVLYARQNYDAKLCELAGVVPVGACGTVGKTTDERSGKVVCSRCLAVAYELRAKWFAQWPEVREYHTRIAALVEGDMGGAVQIPGPPGSPGLIRGQCGFCDGANLAFQGLAARGAKTALYRVARECYTDRSSPLWGCRPVVFVHDEIIAEMPSASASEAAERLSGLMVETMREFVPDVRISAEPALMVRWLKGAECARDESGRLLPVAQCAACRSPVPISWQGIAYPHKECSGGGRPVAEEDLALLGRCI